MGKRCKLAHRRKFSSRPTIAVGETRTLLELICNNNPQKDEKNKNKNDLPMIPPVVSETTGGRKKIETKQVFVHKTNWDIHQENGSYELISSRPCEDWEQLI